MNSVIFTMFQQVLAGLGIFLLGMRFMSDGMQALAGSKLNNLVGAATSSRLRAILVGIGVTFVLQSSSASTVMVVGFVNSGLMSLIQAIGVIFGSNIGTTLSLWFLTLNIAKYGPLLIGITVFFFIFAKKEKYRNTAMAVLGLGMLFFGLELMSGGFKPLQEIPEIKEVISGLDATHLIGFTKVVIISMIFTAVVQSSAAVTGITIGLAANNIIDYPTSVAIILGSNVGTCATAVLACIGTSRNAVRAALAHMVFNIIGVAIVTLLHSPFVEYSERMVRFITQNPVGELKNPKFAVAWTHTVFNILNTTVMYPFMRVLERIVTLLVPVRKEEEKIKTYTPKYLDRNLMHQANLALGFAKREIAVMGEMCQQMLEDLCTVIGTEERDELLEEGILKAEENLDIAQREVLEYVTAILYGNITHATAAQGRRLIKQADEFESVSDHARNVLEAFLKIRNANETLTEEATNEELDLCRKAKTYCDDIMDILAKNDKKRVEWAQKQCAEINETARHYRDRHMERLAVSCTEPVKSLIYSDMLNGFRRVVDHLLNVAETLVD
jgi:phosphate:Na+ symporter